jgi:hypothetical protein
MNQRLAKIMHLCNAESFDMRKAAFEETLQNVCCDSRSSALSSLSSKRK